MSTPIRKNAKHKKVPWSADEDRRLSASVQKHGPKRWDFVSRKAGLHRSGVSCRSRWLNYLSPNVERRNFTREEDERLLRLHETFGNKWATLASFFPGRTDQALKNHWNWHIKKSLAQRDTRDNAIRSYQHGFPLPKEQGNCLFGVNQGLHGRSNLKFGASMGMESGFQTRNGAQLSTAVESSKNNSYEERNLWEQWSKIIEQELLECIHN